MSMSKPLFAGPYEPMKVTRKQGDENGSSHIEPPLDRTWSDLDQLRWLTGVVEADHGLLIHITTDGYFSGNRPVPDSYGLSFAGQSIGPIVGFYPAWNAISNIGLGFETGRRECEWSHTELAESVERVRALHFVRPWDAGKDFIYFGQTEFPDVCDHCRTSYPCDTIISLEGRSHE